ncbi:L,D-transpeptidase [Actibacterium sp. MT2.3-13A]|uniref:L,D-transpeptidase n=1 Tax=Actibacterium sp. MT2.3-13A TaxID=2828332 RepID=UPI0020118676|nr:L,D-transpeptidase [Actibacterium sp. MT2.3-13A]
MAKVVAEMRALLAAVLIAAGTPALAQQVLIVVDLSEQRMTVSEAGATRHVWPVSTAREGKCTPLGDFVPEWLSRHHRSTLYDGAPMPFSIFFEGDYAIHGTDQVERLGAPASAGCIRLHPDHAEILFGMVGRVGLAETLVRIVE